MSMLSMQIDRLRSYADLCDEQRPYLAQELRVAADTIWQLRDDLQRTITENAKLRELCADMFDGMCDHDHCGTCIHWQEGYNGCEYHARMRDLGVEVDS